MTMMRRNFTPGALLRPKTLVLAIGLGSVGLAYGQATTGSIFGEAPVASGETVVIKSDTGFVREIPVDGNGRFSISSLPLSNYTVTLMRDGHAVDSRADVTLKVGTSTEVSFAALNAKNLGTVTVTGNRLPAIDVTSVDSRTVITAQQLNSLPLGRSAEAIALLAPGAVGGYSGFTGPTGGTLVSFAGSSVTENAYYLNGFNTTDPLSGFGGITLPYGAIDQEEILSGGYGAAYGRSDGGVISQVGKRGTNEWHFGAQVQWTPRFAKGDSDDVYYVSGSKAGQIYRRYQGSKYWESTESAYLGGPIIKDKLYFFAAVEADKQQGNSYGAVTSSYNTQYQYHNPKYYTKLDWNINDSNTLELTAASSKHEYEGAHYNYDYDTSTTGSFHDYDTSTKTAADVHVLKYTSYITDDLTFSLLYGKQKISYYSQIPGYSATYPYIGTAENENPAITGGSVITNSQTVLTFDNPNHRSTNTNLRLDVSYKLGDHTITAGIDNQDSHDVDDGTTTSGPGYAWFYGHGDANTAISDSPFVDAPGNYAGGSTGYYVSKYIFNTAASVRVKQRAQYIEDAWQISDRWLVKAGIRNDQFTNYNPDGKAYIRLTKPQWAPRVGFSWDVNGDSSLKVYGNVGRYFLAMPASVALRAAAGSLYTNEYYTYTGIDANGIPTGLTLINSSTGGAVSANNEYGQSPDPKTVASQNIKSEYQDEYLLGFTQQFNASYVWGMKAQVRKIRNILDDICDTDTIAAKAESLGYSVDTSSMNGCYLSNPGRSNTYLLPGTNGGYYSVTVTAQDFGMPRAKRNYYGLETFLEHPFDGKWYGKVDYVYSRSYGNSEGQVRSDIGQTDVSATVDWDFGKVMEYAGGELANDHKHQLKAYGSYQLAPEWMLSANLSLISGAPKTCLGYYGTDQTNPIGYGSYYHYCGGQPSRPGDAGRLPWQHVLSLSAEYRPEWAGKKLGFNVMVYNVFNESVATSTYARYGSTTTPNVNYERVNYWSTPRYVRFGVNYDF